MGGRGSQAIRNSGLTKSPLKNVEKYSGYARELANLLKNDKVYQIKYNGGEAFADAYVNNEGDLHIDYIGSTGNRAGSELLARLAEQAIQENRNLSWIADNAGAKSYYKHIGVPVNKRFQGTAMYKVSNQELESLVRRLRR